MARAEKEGNEGRGEITMNSIQLICAAISGYNPFNNQASAQDDFYYDECPTPKDRVKQIEDYASAVLSIQLTEKQCKRADKYLQALKNHEFNDSSEIYHAFKEIKE